MITKDFIETMTECLMEDPTLMLSRFGRFDVKLVPGHMGVDPRNGEEVAVPTRMKPSFKPSKLLVNKLSFGED